MHKFLTPELIQGLEQLRLMASPEQQQRLLRYIEILHKWNQAYNLISEVEPAEILTRHILDSLSIVPYVTGQRILDIGTGAGLPGIPLAIVCPDKTFTLVDSRGKKTRFLTQVKQELGLTNVTVVHARAETYTSLQCFDNIVARAVASVPEIIKVTKHLCCQEGMFVLMKGAVPDNELEKIPSVKVIALHVPKLDEQRHLVLIQHSAI